MSTKPTQKKCFIICPIGDPDSEIRKTSDKVMKYLIMKAINPSEITVVRGDQIDKPGLITTQIIQYIIDADVVIADLSGTNPNVFYELGIRHTLRKPVVQIMAARDRIPFDVAGLRTIIYDLTDIESVSSAIEAIRSQIHAALDPNATVESPVTVSAEMLKFSSSQDPNQKVIGEMVGAVNEMRKELVQGVLSSRSCPALNDEDSKLLKSIRDAASEAVVRAMERSGSPTRRRRYDPFFLRELAVMSGVKSGAASSLLLSLSYYKDSSPWIYELGVEAYRLARDGKVAKAKSVLEELSHLARATSRMGMLEEFGYNRKEVFMMMEELPMMLDRYISELGSAEHS
jgi:hypothetical protein